MRGNSPRSDPVEQRARSFVGVELGADRRPEVVRRAAAAEGEPVVGGPLPVDDHVAAVGERRTVGEPDLGPHSVGSGSVAIISE